MVFQTTLKLPFKFSGVGVHSGLNTNVTVKPAPENTGIVFVRTDLTGDNVIKGSFENVVDTKLCTVIANGVGAKVSTIEHLMSAFYGLDVDNAIVEIDAEEMPILDGSSAAFVAMIEKVGVKSLTTPRQLIKILKTVEIVDGDKFVRISPSEMQSFDCIVEFAHQAIGRQSAKYIVGRNSFGHEVSRARTFGFAKEIEMLKSMGLARGGSLDNAIGVDDNGVMNPEGLRYDNEFAVHKLLDLIGDLYLSGQRLLGAVASYKSGHALNNLLLRKLFADKDNYAIINLADIQSQRKAAN